MDGRFTVLVEINLYLIVSGAQALKQGEQIQPLPTFADARYVRP
jgi:hypothetical protein